MYTIEFRAWIGHIDEINTEDPLEYFSKEFSNIEEAKRLINPDACILWDEGEWQGEYLSISFKSNPGIFDSEGKKVSECRITDYKNYSFEWVDLI